MVYTVPSLYYCVLHGIYSTKFITLCTYLLKPTGKENIRYMEKPENMNYPVLTTNAPKTSLMLQRHVLLYTFVKYGVQINKNLSPLFFCR